MSYEDFTTYTENDPNGLLTVTPNSIISIDNTVSSDNLVYKDMGVAFFTGDYTHQFEVTINSGSPGSEANVMLANAIGDTFSLADQDLFGYFEQTGDEFFFGGRRGGGYSLDFSSSSITFTTKYYITMQRIGTLYLAYIRTGSHTGPLFDTLTVTMPATAWRYVYGFASTDTRNLSASIIENLDLNLVAAVTVPASVSLQGGAHEYGQEYFQN